MWKAIRKKYRWLIYWHLWEWVPANMFPNQKWRQTDYVPCQSNHINCCKFKTKSPWVEKCGKCGSKLLLETIMLIQCLILDQSHYSHNIKIYDRCFNYQSQHSGQRNGVPSWFQWSQQFCNLSFFQSHLIPWFLLLLALHNVPITIKTKKVSAAASHSN